MRKENSFNKPINKGNLKSLAGNQNVFVDAEVGKSEHGELSV